MGRGGNSWKRLPRLMCRSGLLRRGSLRRIVLRRILRKTILRQQITSLKGIGLICLIWLMISVIVICVSFWCSGFCSLRCIRLGRWSRRSIPRIVTNSKHPPSTTYSQPTSAKSTSKRSQESPSLPPTAPRSETIRHANKRLTKRLSSLGLISWTIFLRSEKLRKWTSLFACKSLWTKRFNQYPASSLTKRLSNKWLTQKCLKKKSFSASFNSEVERP